MTRILYVIDDLGLGGAQRQLTALVRGLSKDRYQPFVVSLSESKRDYASSMEEARVPLRMLPQSGKWDLRCLGSLVRMMKEIRPQLVHTWLFTADLYGRLAAWCTQVPVVVSAVRSVEPWKPWHHVLTDRLLKSTTDAFTVNAQAIARVLEAREGIPPEKIHTIYNGIDLETFSSCRDGELRRSLSLPEDTPLVGIIGRLSPEKGHEIFLKAAAQVSRPLPQVHFLVVGSGALEEKLRRQARLLQIAPKVHFLKGRPEIGPIFAALNLVVVSSLYEGCSNVVLEAMACGLPVVATRVGGNPEVIDDGETGLLVPSGDSARLSRAVEELLRDPVRAQALGERARLQVQQRFGLPAMVRKMERLYDRLLAGGQG